MKSQIIEQIGQADMLLPALIAEGLQANDRVKLRLSALQIAVQHARDPEGARLDMAAECRAAGLDPVALETVVARAGLIGTERIAAPGLGELHRAILGDVGTMLRAVRADDPAEGESAGARLAKIAGEAAPAASDTMEIAEIVRLTGLGARGGAKDGDSLHRLIMDLHKALNRLSAEHAEEDVAGAHAFGLVPDDRPAVEAFMRGVAATRRLKFDHPGLAATATRSGGRLVIQDDIGETDAHVVVINVDPEAVTVTYTDVHRARARFFVGLFAGFPFDWSGLDRNRTDGLADGGVFYLVTGRCETATPAERDAVLEAIGAMLVFLIDWNKACKVLRGWSRWARSAPWR